MRLHHRVALIRRVVGRLQRHRRRCKGGVEVAYRGIRFAALWLLGISQSCFKIEGSGFGRIIDIHKLCRRSGLFEGLCDYERDRLVVMFHVRTGQSRPQPDARLPRRRS